MNIEIPYVSVLILTLAFLSIFCITISLPEFLKTGLIGSIRSKKLIQMEEMHKKLFLSGYSAKEQLVWLEYGIAVVFFVTCILTKNLFLAILIAGLIWQIPNITFWHLANERREKFDEQLPVALDQLTSATRAGKSLSQAIKDVANYAPYPVSQELGQISSDQSFGIDLSSALKSARERVGSKSFNLVVTAMLVNIDLGGNLPKAMQVISGSLKEIWRLDQKLHTASAEGRKGGMILCVMPVVVLLIVLSMQPQLLSSLLGSAVGYVVLVVAVVLYFSGLAWMYRILQVDI